MLRRPSRLDAIERVHATLGRSYAEIARALLAGESTLHRWRAGASTPTAVHRDRLGMLTEFVDALERRFPDPEAARRWLDAPFAPLGGRTPGALLLEGRVETLVGALAVLASAVAIPPGVVTPDAVGAPLAGGLTDQARQPTLLAGGARVPAAG